MEEWLWSFLNASFEGTNDLHPVHFQTHQSGLNCLKLYYQLLHSISECMEALVVEVMDNPCMVGLRKAVCKRTALHSQAPHFVEDSM